MGMRTRFLDWVLLRFFKRYLKKYPHCDWFMCYSMTCHPLFWVSEGRLRYYLSRDFGTSRFPFLGSKGDVRRREWVEKMIIELEFGRLSPHPHDDSYPCCGDPGDCWEPCGDLGKSEEHVRVSDYE